MINERHYASSLIRVSLVILSLVHASNRLVESVFREPCVITSSSTCSVYFVTDVLRM